MKAVVDENVPRRLARALRDLGCDVASFPFAWKGLKNGKLLAEIASTGFGCLITCDKNLPFQQTLVRWNVAVVVLPNQRFQLLQPIASEIARAVRDIESGAVVEIQPDGKFEPRH